MKCCLALLALGLASLTARAADTDKTELAAKAQAILKANCYRCHGQSGAVEGGMSYILDRDKLVTRRKVIPGSAATSPLYKRVAAGKMPPPDQKVRPSSADIALLKKWIDAGAPSATPAVAARAFLTEAGAYAAILADLDKMDRRSRRFARYFTLAPQYNAGLVEDELQSYRVALSQLLNSLSWHPRVGILKPVDSAKTILRIDLRDYMWDANLWNRLLAEYPYGVLLDTAVAKACSVATLTRLPVIRADWFIATACRPPLYQDLLQLPNNANELERQLRVDVTADIQQERVARAGFNGSGVARNNRILERHVSVHGAYWRTYDFEAVQQNLTDRDLLLPDRRNIFAYPLGPGGTDNTFQHAGGEIIFNLPNGLHAFMLVNANNIRVDKAPNNIVSDPKRPDRQVETGISCMSCHVRGINFKDDQIRDHVAKNPKAFAKADAELIRALYPPKEKMKALMDDDAERYRKAIEKTGGRINVTNPLATLTLRYEADVDLPTVASEVGLTPAEFLARVGRTEIVARNLGALRVGGGTVARQVWVQAFADIIRELRLGLVFQPGQVGQRLPDNTGEIDPLEAQSSPANSTAFSPDGRLALFASADKSVRLWDVDAGRDLRRFIGHTASVWAVAYSPDGKRALSGGADNTVRLWEVETGREIKRLDGHEGLVSTVAFSPDGKQALSGGYDHAVILWDLESGQAVRTVSDLAKYINCVAFAPDGQRALVCGENTIYLIDLKTGKERRRFEGHRGAVTCSAFSPDGTRILSGSDDRSVRLWETESGRVLRDFKGHTSFVKCVAFAPDGKTALTAGTDLTVRLWDVATGKELKRFARHEDTIISVAFTPDGSHSLSGSRDAVVLPWRLVKPRTDTPKEITPMPEGSSVDKRTELRPAAVIPVGGTVGNLMLSSNRKWLYYLSLADGKLGRVDASSLKRDRELRLADGTEALCLTPDGKTLVAVAADKEGGKVQVIDPLKMKITRSFAVGLVPYDVSATDSGLAFISGGKGDWTDVAVVRLDRQSVLARWGGVWTRSFLQLSADQKRLYFSTQGVSPGQIEAFVLPKSADEKPAQYGSPARGQHPLGGEFLTTSDGKYLLCKNGTVLRLSADREDDLKHHLSLKPFLAAAVDPAAGLMLAVAPDGSLRVYSYPDFKLRATYRLAAAAYQVAFDGKQMRLYAAVLDPKGLSERPRARSVGDIHVYELKELLVSAKK
jgi:WD40 repeat protein